MGDTTEAMGLIRSLKGSLINMGALPEEEVEVTIK